MPFDLKFHHIGIATRDIETTASLYHDFGFSRSAPVIDLNQNVTVCFLTRNDHPLIELVMPLNDQSPVNNILDKNGVIPYHLCYETPDMMQDVRSLKNRQFIQLIKPTRAAAFNNRLICFLWHKNMGLIELLQS